MQIKNGEDLKELLQHYNKVIICGSKAMVVIVLRWFQKQELLEMVAGTSRTDTKKAHTTFLELEDKPMNEWKPKPDTVLLFAVRREEGRQCLLEKAQRGWTEEQLVDIEYEFLASLSYQDHPKTDFMCVGFPKTGTTSLYAALKKNKKIYMPRTKETKYGNWKHSHIDGPERYTKSYYTDIPEGSVVGGVEPSYLSKAPFVYETCGPDVKLIFVLRNPASATFSYFRMMVRRSVEKEFAQYYKKYWKYTPKMFQDYMQDFIFSGREKRFLYDVWIQEYLQYFKKEQMMFILFEELIREPERILREVQEFIGVEPKKMTRLPHVNTGKEISRNYPAYRINAKLQRMKLNRKQDKDEEQRQRFQKFQRFVWKFTLVDNDDKITVADKARLMDFYGDSIRATEKLIGRNLKDFWYD